MMSKQRTSGLAPAEWIQRAMSAGVEPAGFIALTPGA